MKAPTIITINPESFSLVRYKLIKSAFHPFKMELMRLHKLTDDFASARNFSFEPLSTKIYHSVFMYTSSIRIRSLCCFEVLSSLNLNVGIVLSSK